MFNLKYCLSNVQYWQKTIAHKFLSRSVAEYCDQPFCLCVCRCVCVCPRAYLWNCWTDLREILYADPLWKYLSPPLAALHYVTYFWFMNDVMFGRSGPYGVASLAWSPSASRQLCARPGRSLMSMNALFYWYLSVCYRGRPNLLADLEQVSVSTVSSQSFPIKLCMYNLSGSSSLIDLLIWSFLYPVLFLCCNC